MKAIAPSTPSFLLVVLLASIAPGLRAEPAAKPVVAPQAAPFSPADVRLLDGPLKQSRDAAAKYLLSLDVDRLLAPYFIEAGLSSKAQPYGGWETKLLPGVGLGFYLSGISCLAVSTDEPEFGRRLDYILDQLAVCQQAAGGYLLGTRDGRAIFARIEKEGKFPGFAFWGNGSAEPYYALEKLFSGLRDAFRNAGRTKALQLEVALGDWLDRHMSHLSDAQLADLMTIEFGGMNWVMSDLYADTGDARYLALSHRWQDKKVFAGLAAGIDDLAGKHANTQFPKFSGLAARYPFSGDPADLKTAAFFWESVVRHHSFATGGNSEGEHFVEPDRMTDQLTQRNEENCNEYNMLRLTQLLFNIAPKAEHAEYMERVMFNHILAAQDVRDGRICYFLPLKSGASRYMHDLYNSFACCVCSGFDSYSRNSIYIYSHSADALFVNLFAASKVNWKERGLTVTQSTKFPDEDTVNFRIQLIQPSRFALRLRHPAWAVAGITVRVNGVAQPVSVPRGEFLSLEREWRDGDTVTFQAPFVLRYEAMPDNPDRLALFCGPIVLAGDLGPMADPASEDPAYLPRLVPDDKPVGQWLQSTGASLMFQTSVARPRTITLLPLFRLHDRNYIVYWDKVNAAGWDTHAAGIERKRGEARQFDARTFDKVDVSDPVSEQAHQMAGDSDTEHGFGGLMMHRIWRRPKANSTLSYTMRIPRDQPVVLHCLYTPQKPSGNVGFQVEVDGTVVGREGKLQGSPVPSTLIPVDYGVPAELTRGKDGIRVTIRETVGGTARGVTELRIVRP